MKYIIHQNSECEEYVECSSCKRNHRNAIYNHSTDEYEIFGKCKRCQLKYLKDKEFLLIEDHGLIPGWRLWQVDKSQKFDFPGYVSPSFKNIQELLEYIFVKYGPYLFEKMNIIIVND